MSLSPSEIVTAVIHELEVEELDKDLYRGSPNRWPSGHVFGGHVVAQAMHAASHTVPAESKLHSLHCYFMRPGKGDRPIIYSVDRIRDGRSFNTRRIVAQQNGEAIFAVAFSYHRDEEGLAHQIDMADIPPPEELDDDEEYFRKMLRMLGTDPDRAPKVPFEMRTFDRIDVLNPQPKDPVGGYWMKLKAELTDDERSNKILNAYLLAYQSDFAFLSSVLRPHAMYPRDKRLKTVASLDHTMWYHSEDFMVDDWIFYKTEGYWSGKARGLARGALYRRDGTLIASTAQECLIRLTDDDKSKLGEHTPDEPYG